ncbi:hypothetical protein NEDG_01459 [Nematocida displodere]|uniref:FACT complex subunit n=1 Tax=Nematocida displodere TaxID=1805483 RepID=A0A177EFL0_9MICR|nr:hypothetical protein NEDG_01459 [Nematocida displodere]
MGKVHLECALFQERVKKVIEAMGPEVDGLMIAIGKREDTFPYGINSAMFLYLLGYEFPETALIIRRDEVLTITSAKKTAILEQLKEHANLRPLVREKGGGNQESINAAVKQALGGKPVGILSEERGELISGWVSAQNTVDITSQIEKVFFVKDAQQKEFLRLSGTASVLIGSLLESKIKHIIKTDDRVIHEELSEQIETALETEMKRLPKEIDQTYLELCFKPIIQSGGRYQLKQTDIGEFINPFNDQLLYFDIVSYYICVAYRGYCTLVGRTLLISPTHKSRVVLGTALRLMDRLVKVLGTDKTYREAQDEVKKVLENFGEPEHRQELQACLRLEMGRSIGVRPIEGKSSTEMLNTVPEEGMSLSVSVSFENVSGMLEEGEEGAIHIENVVLIEQGRARLLTPFSSSVEDYVMEKPVDKTKRTQLGRRLRNRDKEVERANEISEHQKQLMDMLIEEQQGYYRGEDFTQVDEADANTQKFASYQKETQVPRGTPVIKIDKRVSTVVIPVFGMAVPFHINAIKNATKTAEDGVGYLKVSFFPPAGDVSYENNLLSLVVKDSQENIATAWKEITDMKKTENEPAEEEVEEGEQEELLLQSGKVDTLQYVYSRYDHRMGTKKNAASTLELHKNGLRYHPKQSGEIDVLFTNVKHMFYQPGAAESPTLIHFKLHTPISILERKTVDIQFFRDCLSSTVHDTRKIRNRHGGDDAEMYEEEEEERLRQEVNDTFLAFAEKISLQSRIILEEPLSKGFFGVPHRQSVLIQPTSECIVNLTEFPFFILPLKDIEILNFERRVSGVTTCDMVFILKDKTKAPVYLHSVASSDVAWLMDFFDSKNICFMETKVNIQWSNVLKSILANPVAFYEGGAWAILQPNREGGGEDEDLGSDAIDLDTTEEEESEEEEFSTNDDDSDLSEEESIVSNSDDSEQYANSDSEDDSFVVDDSEESLPKRKKSKKQK